MQKPPRPCRALRVALSSRLGELATGADLSYDRTIINDSIIVFIIIISSSSSVNIVISSSSSSSSINIIIISL